MIPGGRAKASWFLHTAFAEFVPRSPAVGEARGGTPRSVLDPLFALAVVAVASVGAVIAGFLGVGGTGVVLFAVALSLLLYLGRLRVTFALALFGVALACYATLGRGFAHLGFQQVYVGELLLGLLVLVVVLGPRARLPLSSPVVQYGLLFILWGLVTSVPYLSEHGVNVFRDAVVWGYAAFGATVVFLLGSRDLVASTMVRYGRYARALPWLLMAVFAARELTPLGGLLVPGTAVPLIGFKAGDSSVHLAAAASFVLLGLHGRIRPQAHVTGHMVWWVSWLTALVLVSNRAGLLAVVVSLTLILLSRPASAWVRALFASLVLLALPVAADIELRVSETRTISPGAQVDRFLSIFSPIGDARLDNTRQWRMNWWRDIVGYTFAGEYFWMGKGYGINLASADGYQVLADEALRSPHNSHLTILARSGVPGFAIWIALQVAFGLSMIHTYLWYRRNGFGWWARTSMWLLAYWLAWLVHMSFDVVLEGPQGGIWFWAVMGFGVVLTGLRAHVREENGALP